MADDDTAPRTAPLQVSFFGRPSDIFGKSVTIDIPEEGLPLEELRQRIEQIHGGAARGALGPHISAMVDDAVISGGVYIKPGQDVAFISRVSGG